MRILVTGGAGFIGSHVVDALAAAGHRPVVFDTRRMPHGDGDTEAVRGDILDRRALTHAAVGCDAVVHLAAAADVDAVQADPSAAEEVNARGTLNVLEAARAAGVPRVIYASTIWVYSDVAADGAVDEATPLTAPAHLYTATKLAGELYCRSYEELYGLSCTILRFGIPYGPRARPTAVIPAFVRRALDGDALTINGGGQQRRRLVYVEDLAEGVVRALVPDAAGRTYNLVGDADVSILEIAETVRASSTRRRSGSTPTRSRRTSTRTRCSRCRRTSTRRRSSPARCTAARMASSTACRRRSCASGSPTARAPGPPRYCRSS